MEKKMVLLGQEVTVKDRVPYKDKLDMAEEFVARVTVFNEEMGIAYESHLEHAVGVYCRLKLYTDADMAKYDGYEGLLQLMDDIEYDNYDEFLEYIQKDSRLFNDVCFSMMFNVKELYEEEHSLRHKVAASFGFLFDGKDITETMAQAREINEPMIELLGAIKKQPIDMSAYAKKKK